MIQERRLMLSVLLACSIGCPAIAEQPFPLVTGHATHILPETHNNESGYFSVCVGHDQSVYIGTAKYGENAYLVEFNPHESTQRIVIDTHAVCGLTATGYAAQAKIHTRNFVGPSGVIYVGSKQGYPTETDKTNNVAYPGGYVMSYDPRTGLAQQRGMPYAGEGVIDVVADEERQLLYVVSCEDQHWLVGDLDGGAYREIGPILTPYATTLIDGHGRAFAITHDFQLARYDPRHETTDTRPIELDGKTWTRAGKLSIPYWVLDPNGRTAWLIQLNDPTVIEIDLGSRGDTVRATSHGKLVSGEKPDCRAAFTLHPDGRLYAIIKTRNDSGFAEKEAPGLNHLVRFDRQTKEIEELGVLAIENPDFFDFSPLPDGKRKPWTHGVKTLPDGTPIPQYHQGLAVSPDGTLYALLLYPYTLLRINDARLPEPEATPAKRYIDFALGSCDAVERRLPTITALAETVANRHIRGGMILPAWNDNRWPGQSVASEIRGRSGGIMHLGRLPKPEEERSEEEKAQDTVLMGWQREPDTKDLDILQKHKKRGAFLIGFGPKEHPALAPHVALCDAWLDSGFGEDDTVVDLHTNKAGRANQLVNHLHAWVFVGELVSALTRHGKMPVMWKSYLYRDGKAWHEPYLRKKAFHDEYEVPPIAAGHIGSQYLDRIRYLVRRFRHTQLGEVEKATDLIVDEFLNENRKTCVALMGHTLYRTIGEYEDGVWAEAHGIHHNLYGEVIQYAKQAPRGALLLRLGYFGFPTSDWNIFIAMQQDRIMLVTNPNDPDERPEFEAPQHGRLVHIDMGCSFGDACVPVPGYPLLILPPSGIMQSVAYECINVEVLARLATAGKPAAREQQ